MPLFDAEQSVSPLAKLLRFLLGVLVFAGVGPPVGGMVAWLAMGAQAMRSPLPFVAGSYLEGVMLAAGAGVLTGMAALLGITSWLVPVIAAVLVNLVMYAMIAQVSDEPWLAVLRMAGVFLLPSVIAALVCWFLTRGIFSGTKND